MRLTQNLTLALTLTVTLIAGVFAAPNDFPASFQMQKGTDTDNAIYNIGGADYTFQKNDATKLFDFLASPKDGSTCEVIIQGSAPFTSASKDVTLDNGLKLTATPETTTSTTAQKLTFAFSGTASKPDVTGTIDKASDIGTQTGTADFTISKPTKGLFHTITGSTGEATNIHTAITNKEFRHWTVTGTLKLVTAVDKDGKLDTTATGGGLKDAEDGLYCYAISDKGMLLCVKYTKATTTSLIFVRPGTAGWGLDLSKAVAPALTFLVGAGCAIISSHVHKNLDPDGYAAGYEASSLPGPFKAVLATPEGFEGVDYYDDQPGAPGEEGMIKIDSQGRRVRVKRDSTVAGGEGADSEQTEKKEGGNAYGVSAIAALLLLPFLL